MTDITSFLRLWVILLISQGTVHSSKPKCGLEGWKSPLRFSLFLPLCTSPTRKIVSVSVTCLQDIFGCSAGNLPLRLQFTADLPVGLRAAHLRCVLEENPYQIGNWSNSLFQCVLWNADILKEMSFPRKKVLFKKLVKKSTLDSIIFIYAVYT